MTDKRSKENPMEFCQLRRIGALFGGVLALLAASTGARSQEYTLTTVADNLDNPWSLVQLPDESFLVTQRTGELLRVSADGETRQVGSVPPSYFAGQGGLFDVVLHPDFESNQWLYLSYAHGTPTANGTAVTRARLDGDVLRDAQQILLVEPLKDNPQHYGGKMMFLPDGTLLLTTGEGFDYREAAQDLDSELGKVLRINDDGSVPADNPFGDRATGRIWTYGHRNPQGLALDPGSGTVYLHEHGPRGGDEINILLPGLNYGWPAITYGRDYSGARVSPFTAAQGMEQPLLYWVPSIAPSGMAWYGGDRFPQWRGDLFVGALVDREVRRVDLENGEVVGQESLFTELESRIREVRSGRDGYLYLLTDGAGGQLVRVSPKAP
jgi:glucose/arabinose dehydrogenase